MWAPCSMPAHRRWNHLRSQKAPQPHDPEASVVRINWTEDWKKLPCKIDTPFHWWMNWNHHSRSEWVSSLSLIKWSGLAAKVDKSINLRRNTRLAGTTLLTWLKVPINDKSSRFLHAFLVRHAERVSIVLTSLSWGSRICKFIESSSIPKKVMVVDGPVVLVGSRGSPANAQVSSIMIMFLVHSSDAGRPIVRKSST